MRLSQSEAVLQVLRNGSLYVSEVYMEDMGFYGCTAGNSGGFEREEIYLQVNSAYIPHYVTHTHCLQAVRQSIIIIIIIALYYSTFKSGEVQCASCSVE